ncbi:hypothetical protein J7481_22635 [Labrenzia sp. R4_2]|nr:hypothetical protein [Labrenzia sp. R4_2]
MFKKPDAAAYCGIPASKFEGICTVVPVQYPDGSKLWDVQDLDAWLDQLKSGQADSDDDILNRLGG